VFGKFHRETMVRAFVQTGDETFYHLSRKKLEVFNGL
jgi:hypothetical protein